MSMKRVLIVSLAVALIGAGAPVAAAVGPPRARLRHFVCQRALDPAGRAVSVTAVMRPITGTAKMALRFELLSRAAGASTMSPVSGGDLNRWISPPNPTLGGRAGDVWILNKQVVGLMAPAVYRLRVLFRWTGAHNRVLAVTEKASPRCDQPELRPDLAVGSINVAPDPSKPNLSTYVATIRNAGSTAAGRFEVLYSPGGGGAVKSHTVGGLAAHASVQVRFVGPPCSSTVTPTITADPNHQVDDPNQANNSKTVVCSAVSMQALKRAGHGR
jgi:hypothetical protein